GSGPSAGFSSLAKISGSASAVTKSPGPIPRIGPTADKGRPVRAATFSAETQNGTAVTSGMFATTSFAPVAAKRVVTSSYAAWKSATGVKTEGSASNTTL